MKAFSKQERIGAIALATVTVLVTAMGFISRCNRLNKPAKSETITIITAPQDSASSSSSKTGNKKSKHKKVKYTRSYSGKTTKRKRGEGGAKSKSQSDTIPHRSPLDEIVTKTGSSPSDHPLP